MKITILSLIALCLCSCGDGTHITADPHEAIVTVIAVSPGEGPDANFYVHRDTHTLLEIKQGEFEPPRRIIAAGNLGEPGDTFQLKAIGNARALYW